MTNRGRLIDHHVLWSYLSLNIAESQIEAVFFAALEKGSPAERAAFLENACAGDAELRKRVEQLLSAQPQLGDFLVSPTIVDPLAVPPFAEAIGSMIGPYKLREVLGEGGMGTVYVAEQVSPIRRKVALKVIKPGMDTREVVMRFEAERQALALMDHPHIAKVLDVGATPSGRPYFVMELIPGVPITDYSDERELSPRERLALFIRVCQGMQHAHEKGIVHRDLKPSNLLVTQHDGIPHPKVIDFGVAKAVEQKLTEITIYTRFAQVIGTPLYMSPEQAQLDGADVDPRSDVYSLGVVLYELLTGTTPFDGETLKKAGFDGMRKIIREEEPPRPSSRMSTLDARRRSTITLRRGTDPGRLMRLLRGDLDWIVMKALDKDRNRRYPSAGAFAADVQRFLDDKPVEARPPSPVYRARKFVHRHWRLLSAAALVAVCAPPAIHGVRLQFVGIPTLTRRLRPVPTARPELNLRTPENSSPYAAPESAVHSKTPPRQFLPSLGPTLPGLVSEAAYPEGVRKWQLTTRAPRGVLTSAVRNPDETRIALGEANNVRIYDAANMRLLHVLVGHTQPVTSVAWHPSGDVLASAGRDGTVRLWSSVGIPARVLEGHVGVVHQVAWRPDGSRLASCSADGTVRLWNADATLDRVIEEADRHVFCIDWSPDGMRLASGGGDIRPPIPGGAHGDNRVRVWEVDTGKLVLAIGGSERHSVLALDWRPDGEQLAAGYGDVYRSTQDAFVPIRDAGLRLWNKDGTAAPGIKEVVGSISAVAWDAEGLRLAFAGRHQELRILSSRTGTVATSPKEYTLDVNSLQWTKDSSRVLVTNRAMLREWDGRQLLQHLLQGLASEGFYYVHWSPDGTTIAANDNHNDYFWTAQGTPASPPDRNAGRQFPWWMRASLDLRPDGTAAPRLEGPLPLTKRECAWSRTGLLACATWNDRFSSDPAVHLWNQNGKRLALLRGHRGGVESVAWSPEGDLLASGGGDSVRLWNADGSPGPVMTGHTDEVFPVAWSPDGRWLASAGSDATIRLWRRDGTAGPVFRGHQGGIHDIAWSPDSQKIASASWLDSTLRVWDVEFQTVLWQALLVADNAPVTISPSGQVWHGDRALMADSLLYLSERPDGGIEASHFADFRVRAAQPLVRLFAARSDDAIDRKAWNDAEAAFTDARSFAADGDSQLREQMIEMGRRLEHALTVAGESERAQRVATGVALLAPLGVSAAPPKSE